VPPQERTAQFADTIHFSPWADHRDVSPAFFGGAFLPGEYHEGAGIGSFLKNRVELA
jgi:hypothetical protein